MDDSKYELSRWVNPRREPIRDHQRPGEGSVALVSECGLTLWSHNNVWELENRDSLQCECINRHRVVYFKIVNTMPCKFHLNKDKQQNLALLLVVRMQSVRIFVATWTLRSFYFRWGERFKRLDMIHRLCSYVQCTQQMRGSLF